VEDGHDDLEGTDAHLGVDVDGDAATVVTDAQRVIGVESDDDVVAVAGEGFVDRVVDDFSEELVEAALAVVADVHAGALSNGFKAFEDLDLIRRIVAFNLAQQLINLLELIA
jgi:hypothetical protein